MMNVRADEVTGGSWECTPSQGDAETSICCDELLLGDTGVDSASVYDCARDPPSSEPCVHYSNAHAQLLPNYSCIFLLRDACNGEQQDSQGQPRCHSRESLDAADCPRSATQRAVVVDRMIAIAGSLGLSNNALFLAVACLDRYLAATRTSLEMLLPLSVACLWVAAKYEAAAAPPLFLFASVLTDGILTESHRYGVNAAAAASRFLVALEASVLATLDYRLASMDTTECQIQNLFQQLQQVKGLYPAGRQMQQQLYSMMSYLAEVSLLECQLLPLSPGILAAASFALAHVLLGIPLDTAALVEATGYTVSQLQTPLQYLCALHTTLVQAFNNGKPYTVSVKYSAPALHRVACVAPLCDPSDPRLVV